MVRRTSQIRSSMKSLFVTLMALLASEDSLQAYTDPGTGMLLWQGLIAGLVGLAFYFRKIKFWVLSKKPASRDRSAPE